MSAWRREKAELLARQYTPGVKNKYWSGRVKDLADGIEIALKEAEERGRREENEGWEKAGRKVSRRATRNIAEAGKDQLLYEGMVEGIKEVREIRARMEAK